MEYCRMRMKDLQLYGIAWMNCTDLMSNREAKQRNRQNESITSGKIIKESERMIITKSMIMFTSGRGEDSCNWAGTPGDFWNGNPSLQLDLGGCSWMCNSLIFTEMYISQAKKKRSQLKQNAVSRGSDVTLWDSSPPALSNPSFLV